MTMTNKKNSREDSNESNDENQPIPDDSGSDEDGTLDSAADVNATFESDSPIETDGSRTIESDEPVGNEGSPSQTIADGFDVPESTGNQTIEMDLPEPESDTTDSDFTSSGESASGQTIEMDLPESDQPESDTENSDFTSSGGSAGGQTIEMDLPEFDQPESDTENSDITSSGESAGGQTIEMDLPEPEQSENTTNDSDFLADGEAAGGQTIEMDAPAGDDRRANATIESDFLSDGEATGGQTNEVDITGGSGEPENQSTDSDFLADGEAASGQQMGMDSPSSAGIGGTVELTPSGDSQELDFSVDAATAGDRTRKSPMDRSAKAKGTVAGNERTVQAGGGSGSYDSRQTRQSGDATLESSDLISLSTDRVMVLWSSIDRSIHPGATIQNGDGDESKRTTNLVIQSRDLREQKTLEPGVGADYELINRLGEGGMGVVYMARQSSIDRKVAIKMLKPKGARDPKQRGKFLSEAVVTGELDHPNIVPIYDLGVNDSGALFYSMKRVVGTPWDDVVGSKSLGENLEILMKVADAIAFAHSRGVLHRDLKPENVMLGDFGEVLVMDWGLAVSVNRTHRCSMGGTPAYMAPEMAAGPFEDVCIRSDVYLLGAILFEVLVGKPPHTGKDIMKCLFAAAKNSIRSTDVTGELMDIAMKAMSTRIRERYASAADFQAAIRNYQSHSESLAMQTRADELREEAGNTRDYETFNRSIFGYEESLERWSENDRARKGLAVAKLEFAKLAVERGDFDLGASTLDPSNAEHQVVLAEIDKGRQERVQKEHRLKLARRAVGSLVATVFVVVGVSAFVIHGWYREAETQRGVAVTERKNAEKQKDLAEEQTEIAEAATAEAKAATAEEEKQRLAAQRSAKIARDNERLANIAKDKEALAREAADKAKEEEAMARATAVSEREAAVAARKQEAEARQLAEYEEYVARIGLAAAKINDNAYDIAIELLLGCKSHMRDWEWRRLMHLCDQASQDFAADAPIESVAISRDGARFVTGGWNGEASIWNRQGEVTATLKHNSLYVFAVAISFDGKTVATGSGDKDGFVKLWNAETGELVSALKGHQRDVVSVAFSKDGSKLATASFDKTARIWDVKTGKLERTLEGHNWWVWDAAFSPDGSHLATVSQDGVAYVWDLASGERSPAFDGHQGPIYDVCFSPDGETVATAGHDKRVLVWRPSELKPYDYRAAVAGKKAFTTPFRELLGHTAAVRCVEFSSDGQRLISGGHDNSIRIWGLESGASLKTLRGHGKWIRSCAFSSDGLWAFSGGYDETAKLWNIEGYEEERVMRGRVFDGHRDALLGASLSDDGRFVLTASRDRRAKKWNAATGREELTFEEGHLYLASSAQFFENDFKLLTAAVDNTARIWDVASGVQIARLDKTGQRGVACVSPDNQWVLTGGENGTVQVWSVADAVADKSAPSLKPARVLAGHKHDIATAAYSPDGSKMLTGDLSGICILWDSKTGKSLGQLRGHTKGITQVVFLNNDIAASASLDKTVAQWDLKALKEIVERTLVHPASVGAMTLTSDGAIVTSCDDKIIRVWDAKSAKTTRQIKPGRVCNSISANKQGQLLTVDAQAALVQVWNLEDSREVLVENARGVVGSFLDMNKNGGVVWSGSFSSDGGSVLTVGGDSARIWGLETAKEQISFSPHGAVASARFSRDGSRVVTASWDNSARIWNADNGSSIKKLGRESAGAEGAHLGNVNSATFSPDAEGKWVLTASDDGVAKLWDSKTGRVIRSFVGHKDRVVGAEFSADGAWVLTACSDKVARVFDVESGRLLCELAGHEWGVSHAVFSTNKDLVVTGSEDNTARVWSLKDLAAPSLVAELKGHTAAVTSVDISPNGKRVLTGCEDFTAKLWDAQTGKEILTLNGHRQEVTSVMFSEDGQNALTSSRDGVAIIWLASELPEAGVGE